MFLPLSPSPLASINAKRRLSPDAAARHIHALQSMASGTEHGITCAAYSFLVKLAQSDFYSPLRLSNTRPFPPRRVIVPRNGRNDPSLRSFHPIPVLLHGGLENKNPLFHRTRRVSASNFELVQKNSPFPRSSAFIRVQFLYFPLASQLLTHHTQIVPQVPIIQACFQPKPAGRALSVNHLPFIFDFPDGFRPPFRCGHCGRRHPPLSYSPGPPPRPGWDRSFL